MYDIKKNLTAGIVNNVYDGSWYKASLIVMDVAKYLFLVVETYL